MTIYTVYDRKTNALLAKGMAYECAVTLGYANTDSFRVALCVSNRFRVEKKLVSDNNGLDNPEFAKMFVDRWTKLQRAAGVVN